MATRLFSKAVIEKAVEMQTCIMPIQGADPQGRVCKLIDLVRGNLFIWCGPLFNIIILL